MTDNKYSNEKRVVNKQIAKMVESVMEHSVPKALAAQLAELEGKVMDRLSREGGEEFREYGFLIVEEERAMSYAAFVAGVRYARAFEQFIGAFEFPLDESAIEDVADLL